MFKPEDGETKTFLREIECADCSKEISQGPALDVNGGYIHEACFDHYHKGEEKDPYCHIIRLVYLFGRETNL